MSFFGRTLGRINKKNKKRILVKRKKTFSVFPAKYLNIGGHEFVKKHWHNLDHRTEHYPILKELIDFDVDLSLQNKWDFSKDSFYELAYCAFVIDQLDDAASKVIFSEAFRVLKKGGVFRVAVPDLDLFKKHYSLGNKELFFIGRVPELYSLPLDDLFLYVTNANELVGKYPQLKYLPHISAWDFKKVERFMEEAGFVNVKKCACRQSDIIEFCKNTEHGSHVGLYVEGVKNNE